MAQTTNYNLPYPSDYTEVADVPEAIKDLAEATDTALTGKVNAEAGKGLSTNDYTTAENKKHLYAQICDFVDFDAVVVGNHDIEAGHKYMKVYRQMKMYNDPETNPVLYGKK